MASPSLPLATGSYKVGRTFFELVDNQRSEIYSPDKNDRRRIVVWVWYPAEPAPGSMPAEYLPGKWVGADSVYQTSFGSSKLHCHSFDNAPALSSQYPVLIFSPAGFSPLSYSAITEDLASNGYVVMGINHTYDAPVTVFKDGSVIPVSQKFMEGINSRSIAMNESFEARARAASYKAQDINFVANELASIDNGVSPISHHLDLTRIGAFGHSMGGNAAFEFSSLDGRCLGAVNLDGALWTELGKKGVPAKPAMIIAAEHPEYSVPCSELVSAGMFPSVEWCEAERKTLWAGWKKVMETAKPAYGITIQQSKHVNFVDVQFVSLASDSPFRPVMGSIDPLTMSRITREYLLAFFNESVKGMPSALLRQSWEARSGVMPLGL